MYFVKGKLMISSVNFDFFTWLDLRVCGRRSEYAGATKDDIERRIVIISDINIVDRA